MLSSSVRQVLSSFLIRLATEALLLDLRLYQAPELAHNVSLEDLHYP